MDARNESFAEMLSAGMRAKGLDYRTLAALAGVSHTYIWQLAAGGTRAPDGSGRRPKRPSREIAVRVAELLDLDVKEALEAAGYPAQPAALASHVGIVHYSSLRPDVAAIFQRGLDETRRGNPDRAIILLKEAVGQGGVSFIRAHTGLGVAYMGMQDYAAAVSEFTKVIELFDQEARHDDAPGSGQARSIDGVELADVLYNRGLANQDFGRHREAVRDFQGAIAARGPHPDLYYAALCFSQLALGRFRRVVQAALQFSGDPLAEGRFTTAALDVRLYQAYALARLGQFEAGLALADTVCLLCPSYWYTSLVQGAIASRFAESMEQKVRRSRGRLRTAYQASLEALLEAGHRFCGRTLALNPAGRESLLVERDEDFAYFSRLPDFAGYFEDMSDDTRGRNAWVS